MMSTQTPRCCLCSCQLFYQETTLVPGLDGPVCENCLEQKSSGAANTRRMGEPDNGPPFSIEFEVCGCRGELGEEVKQALSLLKYGFLRTSDGTVEDEYKSPIYQSFAAFEEVLPTFDTLAPLVDSCCGTHIHVSSLHKERIRWYHDAIFTPLETYVLDRAHQAETGAFWGRTCSYASTFRSATRYDTIEFRLPRFRNATQYRAVVLFCRQAGTMFNHHLEAAGNSSHFGQRAECIGKELLALYKSHVSMC